MMVLLKNSGKLHGRPGTIMMGNSPGLGSGSKQWMLYGLKRSGSLDNQREHGITPGASDDQSTFCSELSGLLGYNV